PVPRERRAGHRQEPTRRAARAPRTGRRGRGADRPVLGSRRRAALLAVGAGPSHVPARAGRRDAAEPARAQGTGPRAAPPRAERTPRRAPTAAFDRPRRSALPPLRGNDFLSRCSVARPTPRSRSRRPPRGGRAVLPPAAVSSQPA